MSEEDTEIRGEGGELRNGSAEDQEEGRGPEKRDIDMRELRSDNFEIKELRNAGGKVEKVKISRAENGKAYLVEREKTIEVRAPKELKEFLIEKYETVMESRYFGRGGVEIVPGQIGKEEMADLVRMSREMTK